MRSSMLQLHRMIQYPKKVGCTIRHSGKANFRSTKLRKFYVYMVNMALSNFYTEKKRT